MKGMPHSGFFIVGHKLKSQRPMLVMVQRLITAPAKSAWTPEHFWAIINGQCTKKKTTVKEDRQDWSIIGNFKDVDSTNLDKELTVHKKKLLPVGYRSCIFQYRKQNDVYSEYGRQFS